MKLTVAQTTINRSPRGSRPSPGVSSDPIMTLHPSRVSKPHTQTNTWHTYTLAVNCYLLHRWRWGGSNKGVVSFSTSHFVLFCFYFLFFIFVLNRVIERNSRTEISISHRVYIDWGWVIYFYFRFCPSVGVINHPLPRNVYLFCQQVTGTRDIRRSTGRTHGDMCKPMTKTARPVRKPR